MTWHKVAAAADIPVGGMFKIELDEDDVAIYHLERGWYATSDICTHASQSLTKGSLNGCIVACPKHGGKFDVTTGAAVAFPCVVPIEKYQVEQRGEDVWVDFD